LPKAYVVVFYRSPPEASFAEYGELAIPAVHAGGGRILARGLPSKIYEVGMSERVNLIEFDSLERAIATREGGSLSGCACETRKCCKGCPHYRSVIKARSQQSCHQPPFEVSYQPSNPMTARDPKANSGERALP